MMMMIQDSMAVIRTYGKPDLFRTITCNPQWPGVITELKDVKEQSELLHVYLD